MNAIYSDLLPVKLIAAAVIVLSGLSAHAQVTSGSSSKIVVGVVDSISGNTIQVLSGTDTFLLTLDERSTLWRGREIHDLSQVRLGDTITAHCRRAPSGNLLVDSLWLNIVTFFGTVSKVTPNAVEALTNPNADPQSAYKRELRTVEIDKDTTFESSIRQDLKPGRGIQVVGVDLSGGRVLASKVTVYEGDRPVGMRAGTLIVAPDGGLRRTDEAK